MCVFAVMTEGGQGTKGLWLLSVASRSATKCSVDILRHIILTNAFPRCAKTICMHVIRFGLGTQSLRYLYFITVVYRLGGIGISGGGNGRCQWKRCWKTGVSVNLCVCVVLWLSSCNY